MFFLMKRGKVKFCNNGFRPDSQKGVFGDHTFYSCRKYAKTRSCRGLRLLMASVRISSFAVRYEPVADIKAENKFSSHEPALFMRSLVIKKLIKANPPLWVDFLFSF